MNGDKTLISLYEIHTIDINGNSVKETDIREAIHDHWRNETGMTLRINIDGVVFKLQRAYDIEKMEEVIHTSVSE